MTLRNIILDAPVSNLHNIELSAGTTHYLYLKTPGSSEVNSLVLNGGGNGTTDWVDVNSDGLADNWSATGPAATYSIINGTEGFSDRAQKVVCSVTGLTNDQIYIEEVSYTIIKNVIYILRFDYKSNITLHINDATYNVLSSFAASPTSITSVNAILSTTIATSYIFFAMAGLPSVNDWFILDNINLIIQ